MLQFRACVIGLFARLADWIAHAETNGPGRVAAGDQLIEHGPEVRHPAGARDRAGKAARAEHLRTAEPAGQVAGVQSNVGQPLIARELHAHLRVVDVLARSPEIGPVAQGIGHRGIEIGGRQTQRRRIDRVDLHRPHARITRVEDLRAQLILALPDRRLRDDELLPIGGDLGLGRNEIQRRRLTDIDLRPVHPDELARKIERRLARLDVRDRRHEVPVRALDARHRVHERFSQPRPGDLPIDTARRELLARHVGRHVADERLRDVHRQSRLEDRVVTVQEAVAVGVRRAPGQAVRRPEPRQLLVEADPGRHRVVARRRRNEKAGGRLQLIVPLNTGGERRPERAGRGRHARIADLRIEPLGRQVDVVIERHLHRLVHRQAERRR